MADTKRIRQAHRHGYVEYYVTAPGADHGKTCWYSLSSLSLSQPTSQLSDREAGTERDISFPSSTILALLHSQGARIEQLVATVTAQGVQLAAILSNSPPPESDV